MANLEKEGIRVLGVAESYRDNESVLGGVVMRADLRIEGFEFGSATVGGLDLTDSVLEMYDSMGREDIQAVLISGLALAWYNIADLDRINDETNLPVISVTYEESEGLEDSIRENFEDDERERRLELYERQSERQRTLLSTGETVFVRSVGLDKNDTTRLVDKFTTHGKKPEPIRVAGLVARSVDRYMKNFQ